MKVSKSEEHALRIVMSLDRHGGQTTLAELSSREMMPATTVAKICGRLRRGGVIAVQRGRTGGYRLSRPAEQISVADVIRAQGRPLLEGVNCAPKKADDPVCPHTSNCGLRSVWHHLGQRIAEVLEKTSIADLNLDEAVASERLITQFNPGQDHDRTQGVTTP